MSTQWWTDQDVDRAVRALTTAKAGTAVRALNEDAVRRVFRAITPTVERIRHEANPLNVRVVEDVGFVPPWIEHQP
jgi:hypothetical protein